MENMIEFKNVTKVFKDNKSIKLVLNKINFIVKKGEFHGFIGANGAGKTTSIRTMLGFYPNYDGDIIVNGINVKDFNFKNSIGYIPEVATFPKIFNVYKYLINFALFSGLNAQDAQFKVNSLIDELNISRELISKNGKKLSSGEQKKILLAQALLNDPKLLILDEPAANLDPKARDDLYKTLKRLNKKGVTIFISSHILSELELYIDSYTIMEKGQVKENTTLNKIRNQNKNVFKITSKDIQNMIILISRLKDEYQFTFEVKENNIFIKTEWEIFKKIVMQIITNNLDFDYIGKSNMSLNELYFNAYNAE